MAGTLRALLLETTEHGPREPGWPTVPLAAGRGLVLLPLTEEIVARLVPGTADDVPVDGFYDLTSGIAEWARRLSADGVVAYVHSEFFGGSGFQAAVAWRDGVTAWGPLFTATSDGEAEDHYVTVPGMRAMALNVLLRWWGVRPMNGADEFAAAGLDRFRWTEEWAAQAEN